ncbi:MAG: type I toxin-antitoxin system SymE family toxin [Bacteroides sp.]|nr:type I toxin-antitoxin system SymE family toxin [Bacteroides sp.]
MPNNKRKANNKEVVTSNQSNQRFKPRLLTLCRKDMKKDENGEWYHTPTVTLAGQWMYDAGFRSGQRIEVIVEERQLILRVEREPLYRPTRKQLSNKIERLRLQLLQLAEKTHEPISHAQLERILKREMTLFPG